MTLREAEKVFDIVTDALQNDPHRHVPLSALKGYDIYQVSTALKLRIANEFLILAPRDDFDEKFSDGLKLYDSGPLLLAMRVVPDNQVDDVRARPAFELIDPTTMTFADKRLAAEETASSFGEYGKSVGENDPLYWQKIYTRLNLDYTSQSPPGNNPIFLNGNDDESSNSVHSGETRVHPATMYLVDAFIAALLSAMLCGFFLAITAGFSEGANWVLSFTNLSIRIGWGLAGALLCPFVVVLVLSASPTALPPRIGRLSTWGTTVSVALALVVVASLGVEIVKLEYALSLGGVLFIFSYTEFLAMVRQSQLSHE